MNVADILLQDVKRIAGNGTVSLFGLGKGNRALLNELKERGLRLILRSEMPVESDYGFERVFVGDECFAPPYEDAVILSPSVRRERRELDGMRRQSVLLSECELFFSERIGKRLAVTGSDGKSSVTRLLRDMLGESGVCAFEVGNCGVPYSTVPLISDAYYVSELSSFNLRYLSPPCDRAVVTNVTPNHLDWHGSFEEYAETKSKIFSRCDCVILNADDGLCRDFCRGRNLFGVFSTKKSFADINRELRAEHYATCESGGLFLDGIKIASLCDLGRGRRHDILNMLAAMVTAAEIADAEAMANVCRGFQGLPHRCEVFFRFGKTEFFDSSIDTSPARAAATLNGLDRRVRVLLGGKEKGLPLAPLREPLIKYASKIAVYGGACENFSSFIEGDSFLRQIPHGYFPDFSGGVDFLTEELDGDGVILCPAAASYGEFTDFAARGDKFKELIKNKFI